MIYKSAHKIISIVLFCASFMVFSQEDEGGLLLEDSDDIQIKFENHYYESLKYKAIGNYTRAITELEKCQQLISDEPSVKFELSKNYFLLNKYNEASLYIENVLELEPTNYWYLVHAKKVYLKQYNYIKTIEIQKEIVKIKPAKKEDLVLVYILANKRKEAQILLDELEAIGIRSSKLKSYQAAVTNYKKRSPTNKKIVTKNNSIVDLIESFEKNKQYRVLKEILIFEYAKDNQSELLKYSEQGMELFPAQALVYLMYGRSLNNQKKYNGAISVLNNGMDFIVDDKFMEADFYEALSLSYTGLNQIEKAKKNKDKSVQLRNN